LHACLLPYGEKHINTSKQSESRITVLCFSKYYIWQHILMGSSWSWSYGSWIYTYLCNQCLSPLKLWVWILFRQSVLDTTLCDKACQWLATGLWISPGTPIFFINKTDRHDITEILLKSGIKHNNRNPTSWLADLVVWHYLIHLALTTSRWI